ncbi:MAG: hypothetical protein OES09_05560 [Gammaproteobacteria bacterium]|nr:hypothetical protein [Gammaproteobacteria bacterium]
MPRRAARVDENQGDIALALRLVGCSVQSLAALGGGVPDLLIGYRGKTHLIEVKNPDTRHGITDAQDDWFDDWNGSPVHVVETAEAAIDVVTR